MSGKCLDEDVGSRRRCVSCGDLWVSGKWWCARKADGKSADGDGDEGRCCEGCITLPLSIIDDQG